MSARRRQSARRGQSLRHRLRMGLFAAAGVLAVAAGLLYIAVYQQRAAEAGAITASADKVEAALNGAVPGFLGPDGHINRDDPDGHIVNVALDSSNQLITLVAPAENVSYGSFELTVGPDDGPDGPDGPDGRVGPDGRLMKRVEAEHASDAARAAAAMTVAAVAGAAAALVTAAGWAAADKWPHSRARLRPARRRTPDGRGWVNGLAAGLVDSAVRAIAHPDDQNRYREEWDADAGELPAGWRRLRWALVLRLCAPRGIRAARRGVPVTPPPQHKQ